jgi:hypothetical protein
MAISKRHVDVQELLGLYLNFVPVPAQTDLFEKDMRIMNSIILKDSIKECIEVKGKKKILKMDHRAEIHKVYIRKTKELAALYPFLFSVENALRLADARHFGIIFGTDEWWMIIRDKVAKKLRHNCFTENADGEKNVRGIIVKPKFVEVIFTCIERMNDKQFKSLADPKTSDDLYLNLSLNDLFALINSDWEISRDIFLSDTAIGKKLRRQDISDARHIIVPARNEIFHGKPIGNISKVASACEGILDKLGFHLGDFDKLVYNSRITRPQMTVSRCERHSFPI